MRSMRIDLIIESNKTPAEFKRLGKIAETYGFGTVWIANNANGRDPFVNFSPLAMDSENICMGPIAVSPFELHPYKMAVSLLSLNELAGGRARLVVGGGGGVADAMGKKPDRPVRAVRECMEILAAAAKGETLSYDGQMYPISWLDTRWVTQTPPMIYAGANGPQMLKSAARCAPGIMVSDFTPDRVRWTHEIIDPVLTERGMEPATYPLNNFWAWHVKESREAAQREARIWLCVRGTIYPDYIRDVVDEDEAAIVTKNISSFAKAYYQKSPDIAGVPDAIVEKIVNRGTSASCLADIDIEIDRFQSFAQAGLTEIALKVYDEPEKAIRAIGEHIIPALK
jgi:5,10-methylenetetrahydromethanopterin reductase